MSLVNYKQMSEKMVRYLEDFSKRLKRGLSAEDCAGQWAFAYWEGKTDGMMESAQSIDNMVEEFKSVFERIEKEKADLNDALKPTPHATVAPKILEYCCCSADYPHHDKTCKNYNLNPKEESEDEIS